jgi:hypothetical protein
MCSTDKIHFQPAAFEWARVLRVDWKIHWMTWREMVGRKKQRIHQKLFVQASAQGLCVYT